MEYLVTGKEMACYDAATIEKIGIPAPVLMERAALAVYEEILAFCARIRADRDGIRAACAEMPAACLEIPAARKEVRVLILAGCGNNGADGLALARLLAEQGDFRVEVVICGNQEKATAQWKTQYEILKHFSVRTGSIPEASEYDILVDALFGVGLSRAVGGDYAELIRWFHQAKGVKIAVDVPSGICSDTGQVLGCAAKVDLTVCFAFGKRGLYFYPGCEYAGKVVVKQIGITKAAFMGREPGMFRYTGDVKKLLPDREKSGNKGTFGKVLIAAGSCNMAGAAVLAAKACYRSGAGMVKVLTEECNRIILQTAVPEALISTEIRREDLEWCDVLVIGPGLGTDERAYKILYTFLEDSDKPLVIDADGLNLLAKHQELMALAALKGSAGRKIILTPHVGEMARLCKKDIAEIKKDPVAAALGFAKKQNCVVVSKDARTLICKQGMPVCMNTSGNSGMATAGSGDVLTGIIAGLLAQGMDDFAAAGVGAYLHGLAGDAAAVRLGQRAMMAGDLVDALTEVLAN